MKRLLPIFAVAASIVALPLSHLALADPGNGRKGPPEKVKLCHVTGTNEDGTRYEGHVIEVAEPAVKAHCNHGDHTPGAGKEVGEECSRPTDNNYGGDPPGPAEEGDPIPCGDQDSTDPNWAD